MGKLAGNGLTSQHQNERPLGKIGRFHWCSLGKFFEF